MTSRAFGSSSLQEVPAAFRADEDHRPAFHAQPPTGEIGVLGSEVRTMVAPLVREGPSLLQRDDDVLAALQGNDDLALHVHLDHIVQIDP